jgi:hypothetical protein
MPVFRRGNDYWGATLTRLCSLIFLAIPVFANDGVVLWKDERPGLLRTAVLVSPELFDENHLKKLCKRVLDNNKKVHFIQVWIVADKLDAHFLPKPNHGLSYDYWRRGYDKEAKRKTRIGEMTAVGKAAVLKLRDERGSVRRVVLRGSDPLLISTSGGRFEVLYAHFRKAPFGDYDAVEVYMQSQTDPSVDTCLQAFKTVRGWFQAKDVFVSVRNDFWFILDPHFPFYYPFDPGVTPPTKEELANTHMVECDALSGKPSCKVH